MKMNRQFFILPLLILLGFFFGCYSDESTEEWPVLDIEKSTYDFGTITEGRVIEHKYKVLNDGHSQLRIIDINTSSQSLTAYVYNKILYPGKSTEIKVIFDSYGFWDNQDHKIFIDSNDPTKLRTVLHLKGKVLADYKITPRVVRIRLKGKNKQFWSSARITNTSDKPMKLLRIETENNRVFSELSSGKLPLSLAPGQEAELKIRFEPGLGRSRGRDIVKIRIQGRNKPVEIPVRIKIR